MTSSQQPLGLLDNDNWLQLYPFGRVKFKEKDETRCCFQLIMDNIVEKCNHIHAEVW